MGRFPWDSVGSNLESTPGTAFCSGQIVANILILRIFRVVGSQSHPILSPVSVEIRERLKSPFPMRVRTLDAIHLATAEYIRAQNRKHVVIVASYDGGLRAGAEALGFALYV